MRGEAEGADRGDESGAGGVKESKIKIDRVYKAVCTPGHVLWNSIVFRNNLQSAPQTGVSRKFPELFSY